MKIVSLFILLLNLSAISAQEKDLFLLLGQSNMAGRGDYESVQDTMLIDKVFLLNDNGLFEPAKNPLNRYSTIRKKCDQELQKIGIGYSFSKYMAKSLKDSVFIIVNARGGTSVKKFVKGGDNGYYESILNRTRNALRNDKNLRLRAIIWHQGESDTNAAADYLSHLKTIIENFRVDLNVKELPLIAGQLGTWNKSYDAIKKEIAKIPAVIKNTFVVDAKGLKNKDAHHFDTRSYYEFGKRYAAVCLKAAYQ